MKRTFFHFAIAVVNQLWENESCHLGTNEMAPDNSYFRGLTDVHKAKIGLSIGAVTGCCSLCEELPDLGAVKIFRGLQNKPSS
jgi:hypothetical protein